MGEGYGACPPLTSVAIKQRFTSRAGHTTVLKQLPELRFWGQAPSDWDGYPINHLADSGGILHGGEFILYGEPLHVAFLRPLPLKAPRNVVNSDANGYCCLTRFV